MLATDDRPTQQHPAAPMARRGICAILRDPEVPTQWACRGLHWAPGRPAMVLGYPGSGKSYAAVSAVAALALGEPAWGADHLRADRPLRALYVDMDMGKVLAEKRLRRIVLGLGSVDITGAALAIQDHHPGGDPLECQHDLGGLRMTSLDMTEIQRFKSAWTDAVRGFDLVLIDPFRSTYTMQENDSTAEAVPRALRDVSIALGVTFVMVHHAGKSVGRQDGKGRSVAEVGRGSSAIDAASGSTVLIEKIPDGRRRIQMTRDGADPDGPPFEVGYLGLDHTMTPQGPGISQQYTVAPVDEKPARKAKPHARSREGCADVATDMIGVIAELTRLHQGEAGVTGTGLVDLAKRRRDEVWGGIKGALSAGLIQNRGTDARPRYFAATQ